MDIQIADTRKEMIKDVSSNPVEITKKRRTRQEREAKRLSEDCLDGDAEKMHDLQDEENEIREKLVTTEHMEVDMIDEDAIECASDDEDPDNMADQDYTMGLPVVPKRGRGRPRKIDDNYQEAAPIEDLEDDDEMLLDECEPEELESEEGSRRKSKANEKAKKYSRRHRTEVEEADLQGDEQEETIFIDNLPNEEHEIRCMLREVKKQIVILER